VFGPIRYQHRCSTIASRAFSLRLISGQRGLLFHLLEFDRPLLHLLFRISCVSWWRFARAVLDGSGSGSSTLGLFALAR